MNKKELAQEIEELGGTANLDRRRLELQVQLISLREEQGIPNHSRAAQTDYQKWTVAMNKAGPKKADLVRFMEQELQMTPRSNDTIVQLQKAALLKIYDLAAPHETDPVGFGQHSGLSYAETVAAHPEYVRWVRTTAAEGQCNPLMTRFYNWLEGQTSVGSNLEKPRPSQRLLRRRRRNLEDTPSPRRHRRRPRRRARDPWTHRPCSSWWECFRACRRMCRS